MTFTVPRLTKVFLVAVSLAMLVGTASAKDVALIVTKSSNIKGVQVAEVTKAFKTPPAKWADGNEVVFVLKSPASNESKILGTRLLNQSADQLPAFYSGAKKTFIIVATDEEVIKAVNSMPHAIGVVDLYSINGSVTVLKVDGKLPLESGYLLHYN